MEVHLVDGTYELFRHFFAVPSRKTDDGVEVGAVRGVLGSMLFLLEGGATHVGVATDSVVESFRNALWPGYKTGAGVAPELMAQFPILEEALAALGIVVWPMVEFEADDAMASAAAAVADSAERVLICTPDKDLAQCVVGKHVVQFDRRAGTVRDEDGVVEKFGVLPRSIPDYLALVGDSADGFPGLAGWGAKSAATLLARYETLEAIPADASEWDVKVRSAPALAATLVEEKELAVLFKELATLSTTIPVLASVEELRWDGPTVSFSAMASRFGAPQLADRAEALAAPRPSPRRGPE